MFHIPGINQPGLNDPFSGAQDFVVTETITAARSRAGIDVAIAVLIDHRRRDSVVAIESDNGSICLRLD
jgi:hypothetical protein